MVSSHSPRTIPYGSVTHPITRIPEELLVAIFGYYVADCWFDSSMPLNRIRLYDWMKVSHVNFYWREIALSWPALWSYIVVPWGNKDLVSMMLSRSKKAILHIRVWGYITPIRGQALQLIAKEAHRLGTIELQPSGGLDNFPWITFLCEHIINASHLSRCIISIPHRNPQRWSLDVSSPPTFGRILGLDLRGLPFSYVRLCCKSSLTSLSIRCGTEDCTTSALLSLLNEMQLLETLELHPAVAQASRLFHNRSTAPMPHVTLPHLKSLFMSTSLDQPAVFLDRLHLPSTVSFEIKIDLDSLDNPSILTSLSGKLGGVKTIGTPRPLLCASISATNEDDDRFILKAWNTLSGDQNDLPQQLKPAVYIRFAWTQEFWVSFRSLALCMLKLIPSTDMSVFRVVGPITGFDRIHWMTLFDSAPQIQHLYLSVSSHPLTQIMDALTCHTHGIRTRSHALPEPGSENKIPVPHLNSVVVGTGARRVGTEARKKVLNALSGMLLSRAKAGCKVMSVELTWMHDSEAQKLRTKVLKKLKCVDRFEYNLEDSIAVDSE